MGFERRSMRARFFRWAFVGWLALLAAPGVYPAIIEVTNTNDSGFGSLRDAMLRANANPLKDEIVIALPPSGPQIIKPLSPLPDIFDPVIIRVQGTFKVELDGSMAGDTAIGLRFVPNSIFHFTTEALYEVRGLVINNFAVAGILADNGDITIANCCIGTDVTGTAAKPNGDGVILARDQNGGLLEANDKWIDSTNKQVIMD